MLSNNIISSQKNASDTIADQLFRKAANGLRLGSASNFRKSGIQARRRRVTGSSIMGRLLPIRSRSQLAGAPAGRGRRAPTLDYRIIRCRPADDDLGLRRRPKSPTSAAPLFADREGWGLTCKRSAFPVRHWCRPQRSARRDLLFRWSFCRPSTLPKL